MHFFDLPMKCIFEISSILSVLLGTYGLAGSLAKVILVEDVSDRELY